MSYWEKIFGPKFKIGLLIILAAEVASFLAYYLQINDAVFFIAVALVLLAAVYSLGLGLIIALAELMIGSMGYLFYTNIAEIDISFRMAIWLIIIFVWLGKEFFALIRNKKNGEGISFQLKRIILFASKGYLGSFVILFIFIGWGVIRGWLTNGSLEHIFLDFNGFLFFALIFPAYRIASYYRINDLISTTLQIFASGLIWVALKSLALLFVFSHSSNFNIELIYSWIRDTGVGEITRMQEGIYRIFFQSHIFTIIGLVLFLFAFNYFLFHNNKTLKENLSDHKIKLLSFFIGASSLAAVSIISFSRSLWLGLIAGLLLWGYATIREYGWKKLSISLTSLFFIIILSFAMITAITSFPYPAPTGQYSSSRAISSRTQDTLHGGAAVSSRWALLVQLWPNIKENPIMGQGFGSTITYKSSDPRVLEKDPEGNYTTFTFEWGWLDIWFKLGILGLIYYIMLVGKIFFKGFFSKGGDKLLIISLAVGVAMVAVVNFFTPYLNHPLGIGYLILTTLILQKIKE
jgi:hypothetical protein